MGKVHSTKTEMHRIVLMFQKNREKEMGNVFAEGQGYLFMKRDDRWREYKPNVYTSWDSFCRGELGSNKTTANRYMRVVEAYTYIVDEIPKEYRRLSADKLDAMICVFDGTKIQRPRKRKATEWFKKALSLDTPILKAEAKRHVGEPVSKTRTYCVKIHLTPEEYAAHKNRCQTLVDWEVASTKGEAEKIILDRGGVVMVGE